MPATLSGVAEGSLGRVGGLTGGGSGWGLSSSDLGIALVLGSGRARLGFGTAAAGIARLNPDHEADDLAKVSQEVRRLAQADAIRVCSLGLAG